MMNKMTIMMDSSDLVTTRTVMSRDCEGGCESEPRLRLETVRKWRKMGVEG
ncbi:hypothetical protein HanPSC8_Chr09g0361591 [Helianthus annuus]|nr:hypothetical protein HanPSC8_Chr09g0361591 [Helianthus annuus]